MVGKEIKGASKGATRQIKHLDHSPADGHPGPIGSVRKNSGGKRQAYYQPQVSTGNAGHFHCWCL